jgi:thiamine-monophosphate kinase
MTRLNEKEIIRLLSSKLGINKSIKNENDDVVLFPLGNIQRFSRPRPAVIALKSDMLIESTDVPPSMRPWQIARKSVVACISDMSAKGINPPYLCLISLGIPDRYSKGQIVDLAKGFHIVSKEFGVKIIGGDTNRSNEVVINCSLVGALPCGITHVPKRNGAKPGDIVICSGIFGYTSCGLKILINNANAKGYFKRIAIRSVLRPEPQQRFGTSMARFFSSSIDSSDGLAASMYELAKQSGVNFLIDNLPSAKGIRQFAIDNRLATRDLIFYGGEEYEIVATIPKVNLERARSLAKRLKLKLYVIGRVEKGDGKVIILSERGTLIHLRERGYVHSFSR